MKKIITLMVILSLAVISVPAMADWDSCVDEPQITTIGTHTNVLGCPPGGGAPVGQGGSENLPPYIKVKWEYDEGDPYHDACIEPGLQVAPNLYATRTVGYYAVVADPNGRETISKVYADIWHPDGTFKYQIELDRIEEKQIALDHWDHAWTVHEDLLTVNEEWALGLPGEVTWWEDVYDELDEQLAYLYYGTAEISYCQPGGWYYVAVRAHDVCNLWGDYLCNKFWYIPTSAVAIDFDMVDYSQEGAVQVSYERWIGGDYIFGTSSKPTVRNIGNCPVELWVMQDHMGFADTYGEWNVMFNARLTADGDEVYYYPEEKARIPGILDLCTMEKLDFSIHVFKGFPNIDYTGIMDLYAEIDDASYIWETPLEFIGNLPYGVPEVPPCDND
jgi:hypothetical protein